MGAILEAHFAQTAGSRSPELNIMCQSLYCGLVNVRKMASAGAGEQSAIRKRVIVIVRRSPHLSQCAVAMGDQVRDYREQARTHHISDTGVGRRRRRAQGWRNHLDQRQEAA